MRTYGQYCAVAKALDVIGDRWTLLTVRELLLRGPCRYTDLRNGLPGIATNLLADRLRDLETAGLVTREEAPPPVAATLFSLTPRGEALAPVLHELLRWGMPLMEEGPAKGDIFRSQWMTWGAEMALTDREPEAPPATIQVLAGEETAYIEICGGTVHVTPGQFPDPAAVVRGPVQPILGLLTGHIDRATAAQMGVEYEGELGTLDRMLPEAPTAA